MYRCPTCVSILVDTTVRRCPVCGENFKRHPPVVIGMAQRSQNKLTSWDIKANAEAGRVIAQETSLAPVANATLAPSTPADDAAAVIAAVLAEPDIDLPNEHLRDSSGRTAGAERG